MTWQPTQRLLCMGYEFLCYLHFLLSVTTVRSLHPHFLLHFTGNYLFFSSLCFSSSVSFNFLVRIQVNFFCRRINHVDTLRSSDEYFRTGKGGKNVDRDSLTLRTWWRHSWHHSLNGSLAGWLMRNIHWNLVTVVILWRIW